MANQLPGKPLPQKVAAQVMVGGWLNGDQIKRFYENILRILTMH